MLKKNDFEVLFVNFIFKQISLILLYYIVKVRILIILTTF